MVRSRLLPAAILGLAVLGAAGCGKVAEEAAEKAAEEAIESSSGGSAQVDLDGDGEVTIESDEGTYTAGTGEVPEAWPDDVPLPDGLQVDAASALDDAGSDPLQTVAGSVDLAAGEVVAFYEDALADWEVGDRSTTSGNGATSAGITFERDGRTLQVGATEADGRTSLTLVHTAPRS